LISCFFVNENRLTENFATSIIGYTETWLHDLRNLTTQNAFEKVVWQKEARLEQTLSLSCYITEWMQTFKAYSVKQSTYDRLLTSAKALEGFQIASMPIGEITSVHI